MDKVITYSFGDNFIKNLADFIEEKFLVPGKDLRRIAIVFGGKRPAFFLNRALSQKIKKSFFAPHYFSTDEFMEYLVSQKESFFKISDLDASFIIYQLASQLSPEITKTRERFSSFLPWAREILSFLERLDLEKVSSEDLENIKLKAEIGYEIPPAINRLLKDIIILRERYHEVLRQKKSFSRGFIYYLAAEGIKEVWLDEFDYILFCNLFYLSKTEKEVIKCIYEKAKAILFFQGHQDDWPVLKKIAEDFSCKIIPDNLKKVNYNLNIYAGFDTQSQVSLVRNALAQIKDLEKTAIVMPNPQNIIPLLAEIASLASDFNVSLGYPLKYSSLYSLFDLLFRAQSVRKGTDYYTKDYLRVLMHPLVKNLKLGPESSVTRVLIHKIEEVLVGIVTSELAGSLFVSLSQIENLDFLYEITEDTLKRMNIEIKRLELKAILGELHKILFYSWENLHNFWDFSSALEDFCKYLVEKSSLEDYPLNLKVMEKLFSIKEEIKNALFSHEEFSPEDIFKIFKDKLENELISFSGSPLKGLQILGLFETRALDFDNVIVMDVNEAILPKLRIYEPLVPRDVTVSLGIERLEKEEEIQRYQFLRLISCAKNVYLIYEESKDKEKSRFIEELIWKRQKENGSLEVISIPKASFQIKVLPKKLKIEKTSQIIDYLKNMTYSASRIDTYLNCPLKFYYRYILGLKEKEELSEDPEGSDIGNFLHELLKETFGKFLKRRPIIDKDFKDYFFKTLDKRFQEAFKDKMKADAFMLKAIIDERMKRFLAEEEKRNVEEIVELEKEREYTVTLGKKDFKFSAKTDRLDRLADGSLLIIDYKSGAQEVMPVKAESIKKIELSRQNIKHTIKSFQLPIYFYCLQQIYKNTPLNVSLYYLRTCEIKLYNQENATMEIFKRPLEFILDEILNPEVKFQADDEDVYLCKNCAYFYLCR
ncbi:MAG: PD-(D/E)XK nuclease family protein [Candidatus Omnitrophica bacterium]|nr:PD-(D/E)XK nuclease family protein [Candidatus Omnitrophota bacterium]